MFSDRTSLIICAVVYVTLIVGAAIGWLNNFVVLAIICIGTLVILYNIIKTKKIKDEDDKFI